MYHEECEGSLGNKAPQVIYCRCNPPQQRMKLEVHKFGMVPEQPPGIVDRLCTPRDISGTGMSGVEEEKVILLLSVTLV